MHVYHLRHTPLDVHVDVYTCYLYDCHYRDNLVARCAHANETIPHASFAWHKGITILTYLKVKLRVGTVGAMIPCS